MILIKSLVIIKYGMDNITGTEKRGGEGCRTPENAREENKGRIWNGEGRSEQKGEGKRRREVSYIQGSITEVADLKIL